MSLKQKKKKFESMYTFYSVNPLSRLLSSDILQMILKATQQVH